MCLENGGVWAFSSGSSYLIFSPHLDVEGENVSIALYRIVGEGSVSGKGFAEIEIRYNSSETKIFNESGYIEMNITSEYAEAWKRYFDELRGYSENTVLQTELSGNALNVSIYFNKLAFTRYVLNATVRT